MFFVCACGAGSIVKTGPLGRIKEYARYVRDAFDLLPAGTVEELGTWLVDARRTGLPP